MHDEACPTFVDMLDNTALGQRLIYESFAVVPKTTWQSESPGTTVTRAPPFQLTPRISTAQHQ